MKKSILLIILMLLAAAQSFAQHFDWVRGYAPGDNVAIVGSVTDSVGNLYILGTINFNTCWENGSRLLPIAPYGNARDLGDALIAKISPDGDLLWHKVIHGETANGVPHDIKLVGDTAFACLVTVPLASEMGYLYYLDTLIRKGGYGIYPDYPMSGLYIATGGSTVTALITFDFDGNVLEQHFLWMSYLDYNGDDIVRTYTHYPQPWYQARTFDCPSFAIDNEGDIYLSRQTYDMISAGQGNNYYVENGTISAIKIWCDRRVVGVVPTDSNLFLSPQILKFSPHFDTLLNARYLYQTRITNIDCRETKLIYHAPHIYARFWLSQSTYKKNLIVFDSTNAITTRMDGRQHMQKSVIIKYDSSLAAVNSIILEDTITNPYTFTGVVFSYLNDVVFDNDSNLAIISCYPQKSVYGDTMCNADNSYFLINGNVVDFHRNAGIIIMDEETLELKHTGQLSTSNYSQNLPKYGTGGNLCCSNNRVFMQSEYCGQARFPNQVIQAPPQNYGICLSVFNYQADLIEGVDYHAYSQRNYPSSICLKDSVLYLMNLLSSGATFGDIQVPSRGSFFACIAKYTDPAFMSTYERPEDTTMVVEVVQEEMTVVRYPNPTTGRLTIDMNGRPLREVWVAAIDGVAEPLPVTHLGDSRYAADLTGRPDGAYILVLVADDHRAYRSTIILQH